MYKAKRYAYAAKLWKGMLKDRNGVLTNGMRLKLYILLARAYERLGKKRYALRCLRIAEKRAPGNNAVLRALDRLRSMHEMTMEEALGKLSDAVLSEKASRGSALRDFEKIIPVFEKAKMSAADKFTASYALAVSHYYTDAAPDTASRLLNDCLRLQPDDYMCNFLLASIYRAQGRLDDEISCLVRCIKTAAERLDVLVPLAIAYAKRNNGKDYDKIESLAGKVMVQDADSVDEIIDSVKDDALKTRLKEMISRYRRELEEKKKEEAKKKLVIVKFFGSET